MPFKNTLKFHIKYSLAIKKTPRFIHRLCVCVCVILRMSLAVSFDFCALICATNTAVHFICPKSVANGFLNGSYWFYRWMDYLGNGLVTRSKSVIFCVFSFFLWNIIDVADQIWSSNNAKFTLDNSIAVHKRRTISIKTNLLSDSWKKKSHDKKHWKAKENNG